MIQLLTDPQVWILLFTLSAIEIVLGIDNLVFISIAVSKLPPDKREFARKFGIAVACITRILLLLTLAWLAGLTHDLFTIFGQGISVRDLVLILGGLFLLVKGAMEIRDMVGGGHDEDAGGATKAAVSFGGVIAQIAVIDIVFSLDSVIAAVGMAGDYVPVMVAAILIAVSVMLLAARPLGQFIDANPTVQDAGAGLHPADRCLSAAGWFRRARMVAVSFTFRMCNMAEKPISPSPPPARQRRDAAPQQRPR